MATRTRYKSPSPVPSPSTKQHHEPSDALSASHFHAQYPQFQTSRLDPPPIPITEHYYDPRFSSGRYPPKKHPELPILSYHNAVPEHFRSPALVGEPVPIVLPPVSVHGNGHRYSPPRPQHQQQGYGDGLVADTPFEYVSKPQYSAHVEAEKPRSLSIQSLISSPGLGEPMGYSSEQHTRKRKGSDAGDSGRGTRHGSLVPTSVSIEDPDVREVVEALGGLKGDFTPTSPPLQQSQAQPLNTATPENEPLIDLITHRAHPLLSSAITTSLSTYAASKSYSASFRYAAESVENRVGLPVSNVVSAVGRRTGLEGVLRRGLQRTNPKANANGSPQQQHELVQRTDNSKKRKTRSDVEKRQEEEVALKALVQQQHKGLVPVGSTQEERERERERTMALENQTWQKRLMLSTSGLGVALNDESLKNLKYCLQWLRFLNVHLSKLVTALRNVVEELDNHQQQQQRQNASNGVVSEEGREDCGSFGRNLLPAGREGQRAALAAKVEGLKAEVVGTMKKVVEVVSNYTGSALPDNARDLIKRHIFSLPQRFAAANASSAPASPTTASKQLVPSNATSDEEDQNSPRSSANRVMVLAKEGLDMMQQVSIVVEGTIIRAEEWCERLGKKKHEEEGGQGTAEGDGEEGPEKKKVSWKTKFEGLEERRASRDRDGDTVMNGNGRLKN